MTQALNLTADPSAIHVDVPTCQTVWGKLDAFLGERDRRNGERANVVIRRDKAGSNFGPIVVRYHDTDIVTAYVDGTVTFESGGWRTYTTKERMNDYCPSFEVAGVKVYNPLSSVKGVWRFSHSVVPDYRTGYLTPEDIPSDFEVKPVAFDGYNVPDGMTGCFTCHLAWDDSKSTSLTPVPSGRCPFEYFHRSIPEPLFEDGPVFFDGITLDATGMPVNGTVADENPDREIRQAIRSYVDGYSDEVIRSLILEAREGAIRGDCLYCQLDSNPSNDIGPDTEHLLSHVEENYRMASLIVVAMQARNYGNPSFVLSQVVDFGCKGDMIRRDMMKYLSQRLAVNTTGARPTGSRVEGWYGNA